MLEVTATASFDSVGVEAQMTPSVEEIRERLANITDGIVILTGEEFTKQNEVDQGFVDNAPADIAALLAKLDVAKQREAGNRRERELLQKMVELLEKLDDDDGSTGKSIGAWNALRKAVRDYRAMKRPVGQTELEP